MEDMKPILNACLSPGLILHGTGGEDPFVYPANMVLSGGDWTLVTTGDWWKRPWSVVDGMALFAGEAVRSGSGWAITTGTRTIRLLPPETGEEQGWVQELWDRMDFEREEYLLRLDQLWETLEEKYHEDLAAWKALIEVRDRPDPVKVFVERNSGIREIAGIALLGYDNIPVDGVVLDERGNAATLRGLAFTQVIAERWQEAENRPRLETYMSALAGTGTPPGTHWGQPRVFQSKGSVSDHALRLQNNRAE